MLSVMQTKGPKSQSICPRRRISTTTKTLASIFVRRRKIVLRNTMAEQHTQRENGDEFVNKLKKFLQDGCGCTLGPKFGPCSQQFSEDAAMFNLNNCLELSSTELDLVILASIQAFTRSESIGEKRESSMHVLLSIETNLQGNVFTFLWRKLFPI